MGFREDYDKLIGTVATEDKAGDILKAKEEFGNLTGKMYGDEPIFEMRMNAFFDWYAFDRKMGGGTQLDLLLSDTGKLSDAEKEVYKGFVSNLHSIFIVRKITPAGMKIRDLFTKEYYTLNSEGASLGFYKDAVFEGRILPYKGEFYLSPALCFHPKDSKGTIKYVLTQARKSGETNILPLVHRLAHMNLKWETYRNIKVRDIYKFEEYGKPGFWWRWL